MQRELTGTRDRVLEGADLEPGDVVLDAGCGTGLLTFGALDRIGEAGHVIGVDVRRMRSMSCADSPPSSAFRIGSTCGMAR